VSGEGGWKYRNYTTASRQCGRKHLGTPDFFVLYPSDEKVTTMRKVGVVAPSDEDDRV
jgi:hypothetical protein